MIDADRIRIKIVLQKIVRPLFCRLFCLLLCRLFAACLSPVFRLFCRLLCRLFAACFAACLPPALRSSSCAGYGAARPRKIGYKPPDRRELEAARDRRMKEIQMWSVVREVIIYSFFLWILMLISYRTSNSNTFLYKDTMERIFITNVDTDVDFSSVRQTCRVTFPSLSLIIFICYNIYSLNAYLLSEKSVYKHNKRLVL